MQPAELVAEIERDNFQGVMNKCAQAHPGCTLCLLVDKLWLHLRQLEKKASDQMRSNNNMADFNRYGTHAAQWS